MLFLIVPSTLHQLRVLAVNEFGASDPTDTCIIEPRAYPPIMSMEPGTYTEMAGDIILLHWYPAVNDDRLGYDTPIWYRVDKR